MNHGKSEIILEVTGVLGHVFPKVFRETLPAILGKYREDRITLVVTTRVDNIRQEYLRHGCFFQSSRDDAPPEFTWKACGAFNAVIRQFRLDFLRHLGSEELNCRINIAIYRDLMITHLPRQDQPDPEALAPAQAARALEDTPATPPHPDGNGRQKPKTPAMPTARIIETAPKPSPPQEHPAHPTPPAPSQAPAHVAAPENPRRGHTLPGNLYQEFFGFERMPFNNTPDSSFFFPSAKHQEALSRLIYAISERKGFVMISGDIGAGKSTLCRTLLAQLPNEVKTAYITHTYLNGNQLVRAIAEDMGLEIKGLTHYEVLKTLSLYLIQQLAKDYTVCIIIDEAQNLTPEALEEVRMISNLETEQEKLVQLILLGQPDLRDKIRLPELKQLRQRIAVQYHLEALNPEETLGYIAHRLKIANPAHPLKFPKRSMIEVYRYSEGIPRLVNILCDNALLTAFTRGKTMVTPKMIAEAGKDLDLEPSNTSFSQFFKFW